MLTGKISTGHLECACLKTLRVVFCMKGNEKVEKSWLNNWLYTAWSLKQCLVKITLKYTQIVKFQSKQNMKDHFMCFKHFLHNGSYVKNKQDLPETKCWSEQF